MKQIDINNHKDLEHHFAENFDSPIFTILANYYLNNKQYKKAKKVCEIGLEHNKNSADGKFVLAKINLCEDKILKAENLLKQTIALNPIHINALHILIDVMKYLKRSNASIKKYLKQLLKIIPDDKDAILFLKTIDQKYVKNKSAKKNISKINASGSNQIIKNSKIAKPITTFKINKNMASFSLVNVLKTQKHYGQALTVLEQIEKNDGVSEKINNLKIELKQLIKS